MNAIPKFSEQCGAVFPELSVDSDFVIQGTQVYFDLVRVVHGKTVASISVVVEANETQGYSFWNNTSDPQNDHEFNFDKLEVEGLNIARVEKVKKAGYDIQMQAYMWLYDCEVAHIDFWLFPCPIELTKDWDDREQLIDLVEKIDIRERLTTVVIERDEAVIQKIKDKIPHCQAYYEKLFTERSKAKVAA